MQTPAEENNNLHKLKEQHTLYAAGISSYIHVYIYALKRCTDMPNN